MGLRNKAKNNDYFRKIIFSDEAYYEININKQQSCRTYWGKFKRNTCENTDPLKLIVRCGFWSHGVIGFFPEWSWWCGCCEWKYRLTVTQMRSFRKFNFGKTGIRHTLNGTLNHVSETFSNWIISWKTEVN